MVTGEGCGSVVVLHRNGRRNVSLKGEGNVSPGCHLKTNSLTQFLGKNKNERVVTPPGNESVCDVLKGNGEF